jgi:hypothetical protein
MEFSSALVMASLIVGLRHGLVDDTGVTGILAEGIPIVEVTVSVTAEVVGSARWTPRDGQRGTYADNNFVIHLGASKCTPVTARHRAGVRLDDDTHARVVSVLVCLPSSPEP